MKKLIRIQIETPRSRGGTSPVDQLTGAPPALNELEAATIQIGFFDDAATTTTTTDLTKVGLLISATADHSRPLVSLTATAGSGLDTSVSKANWDAGDAHATFNVAEDALAPMLAGQASQQLWFSIWGIYDGDFVCWANGPCNVYAAPQPRA